jgi:hypothetical protein
MKTPAHQLPTVIGMNFIYESKDDSDRTLAGNRLALYEVARILFKDKFG